MKISSLDPRISRADLPPAEGFAPVENGENFQTYEVFHQKKSGAHHVHVGSVHAPSPEMAFVFAKEQYTRRGESVNIWVVASADVYTMNDDADIYATAPEKAYREAGMYKVRDKVEAFKKEQSLS